MYKYIGYIYLYRLVYKYIGYIIYNIEYNIYRLVKHIYDMQVRNNKEIVFFWSDESIYNQSLIFDLSRSRNV